MTFTPFSPDAELPRPVKVYPLQVALDRPSVTHGRTSMNRQTIAATMLALAGTGALSSPQAPAPQEQQPPPNRPIFRTAVDYVEVDARVLDEAGNLVRDLKREDFEVLEDGKAQKIDNFSIISIPEASAETTAFTRDVIDPDVVSSTVARETEGRLYVILLDDRQVARSGRSRPSTSPASSSRSTSDRAT